MSVSLVGGVKFPKIYAFTTDQYASTVWTGGREGVGLIKVGQTQGEVHSRVRAALAGVQMPVQTPYEILLTENALTADGRVFTDHEVHKALERAGCKRVAGEWFECTKEEALAAIAAVRAGVDLPSLHVVSDFPMRAEQRQAVEQTAAYFRAHVRKSGEKAPDFLWNAKMRFGKTFTTYQLAKEMGWSRILVLTYKPAVEQAWRDDLHHQDFAGWRFHSGRDGGTPDLDDASPMVWFASFQDVLGTDADGQVKVKNQDLYSLTWDAVVVDEYHFGAWRDAARSIYVGEVLDEATGERSEGDKSEVAEGTPDLEEGFVEGIEDVISTSLDVSHYLYLSGTPFRALTEGEFLEDQVFNWTYSDEQRAKTSWKGDRNPYASLPQMHLLAYEMPESLKDVALNNHSEFSLTEFFRTKKETGQAPKFIHENEVQTWLNLLRGQDLTDLWATVSNVNRPPMPFADVNLLTALQHTVWYLPSVDACVAMRDLLQLPHNTFFRDYQIIVAAGTRAGMGVEALGPVEDAIGSVPQDTKSITLSCGKLMTGVTVPAWAGIFMLRELKSPETYFQAAFRVQSPWSYKQVNTEAGGEDEVVVKEHCYVLDFSPNRALKLVVEYATKLRPTSHSATNQEEALQEFMEFLPVLAFDGSTMSKVSAADVIDYLTKGISSTMLARRWNSPELITLDIRAMEAILEDAELLQGLEQIEMFRNIGEDLTALISSNKELQPKKLAKEPLTPGEKRQEDEAKKKREGLKDKLRRFVTRIPAFMYLTDDRERTIMDIIQQVEPELFEKVTTLKLEHFQKLVDARAFNASKMNDAVWKFRQFEEPSLSYTRAPEPVTRGGWNLRRDERLAHIIDAGLLAPGDVLTNADPIEPVTAKVSEDYGLIVGGVRWESPDAAAVAAGADADGWTYWHLTDGASPGMPLRDLRDQVTAVN